MFVAYLIEVLPAQIYDFVQYNKHVQFVPSNIKKGNKKTGT